MGEIWTRDFDTMREAEEYLKARGFSLGRLQGPAPRGILFGEWDIQKWRNLSIKDRAELHGFMIRYGTVPPYGEKARITINASASDEAHTAIRQDANRLRASIHFAGMTADAPFIGHDAIKLEFEE